MADPASPAVAPRTMEPTRDLGATLPDLLEVLLNKGVYLDLDLIITVADIPLIGVNLRATIAGIETMLEYGMMRSWDEQTREWVRRSVSRHLPLAEDEEIVMRMAGGHRQDERHGTWRPGTVYLTSHRLIVWRADPKEVLWQARLEDVTGVDLRTERSIGGEDRVRLAVATDRGTALLSAAAPERLHGMLREQGIGPAARALNPSPESTAFEGSVWYQEQLSTGPVWRGGTAVVDRGGGVTWKGALDQRPAVRLRAEELLAVDVESGRTPAGSSVVVVRTPRGSVRFAAQDPGPWVRELRRASRGARPEPTAGAGGKP